MAKGSDVVRTSRLEVVDRKGRTRVVIGTVSEDEGDSVGVSILDSHGIERLYMVMDETTASAGITNGENNVAGVGVNQDNGVWVFMAAPDGTIVRSLDSKTARTSRKSSKR